MSSRYENVVTACFFYQNAKCPMNMFREGNGRSQSEREQSKPRGRFTGERLLRERPSV